MTKLTQRIVLITGASSGIGLACARAFAREGARLILAARRKERLDVLINELQKEFKTDAFAIQLDVRNQPDVEKAVQTLPAAWREIEILVNNAGLSRGRAHV